MVGCELTMLELVVPLPLYETSHEEAPDTSVQSTVMLVVVTEVAVTLVTIGQVLAMTETLSIAAGGLL